MYSFVYFSFFTNLSKILAVAVRLLFEKDFEYLSIDLYLLQDWSKHFYARVFFFIWERLQKIVHILLLKILVSDCFTKFPPSWDILPCHATWINSTQRSPRVFKKTQHYSQVSLVKIHLGFNLWWIFGAFSPFFLFALEGVRQKL